MKYGHHVSVSCRPISYAIPWQSFLGNVFPYYLRSLPNITVLQSLMDKDLSIACYAKVRFSLDDHIYVFFQDNNAAAIVSNDSDMILFAVCPVMHARGLVTARRRVVLMYPNHFCEDIGLTVERLPLLSVYLGKWLSHSLSHRIVILREIFG